MSDVLKINDLEYLEMSGLNVMLAHDYYPESHQGGVGIIQNGRRVATNGDLRLEPMPGQWSPVPHVGQRHVDRAREEISVRMAYPDDTKNRRGFNPIDYPDLDLSYTLKVRPEGRSFRIIVDLDSPLPGEWVGKVGLNLELFPGDLFGKTYISERGMGVFGRQPNAMSVDGNCSWVLAAGRSVAIAPESEEHRMKLEALSGGDLLLIDGRAEHNNGWFVVRSLIEEGAAKGAIDWLVSPHALSGWKSRPVVQVSQVGYHPNQVKIAVIELDRTDHELKTVRILRVSESGGLESVLEGNAREWGAFLRYNYLQFDFTQVRAEGMYVVQYGEVSSSPFRICANVFGDRVWQPTLEYFLPIQMCHMRVNENYRVWHGECHMDDATMAPTDFNHVDGYHQGPSTLTQFESGEHVPGLNCGGWHDAGDYDLRVESQADTVHGLALAFEEFQLTFDNTTIDQNSRIVELLRPDGKPDVLQQIEHGCLAIVGGYNALGRLYRGIIEPTLRQYVHLGDAATVTDNRVGTGDDRWVFTEDNPRRELGVAGALAAASRALRGYNEALANDCLEVSRKLFEDAHVDDPLLRLEPAIELLLATGETTFAKFITGIGDEIAEYPDRAGWLGARAMGILRNATFDAKIRESLVSYRAQVDELEKLTPYGLPYQPHIWGAGWGIQRFGVKQYWLHKALPDLFPTEYMLHAVNFVLGCHPGQNTASFVSGVGAVSLIPGYGVNRADHAYIPGGIGSGTALIRPDFPELLEWPYLWQQTEYCLGYPTSDFVFLIAAADYLLNRANC